MSFEDFVEIVVSDNSSEEDLETIIKSARIKYPKIDIVYNRNAENIGLARNFLKVVEISSSEFCWIIGSDDFVKLEGVKEIISIITNNEEIDFVACNYDLLNLDEKIKSGEEESHSNIYSRLNNDDYLISHNAPNDSFLVEKLDDLIAPMYKNVLLGAIMVGIFRKSLWDKVDMSNADLNGFNTLKKTYPHCYVYAKAFLGKNAYYCGKPLITVGEGTREWTTQTGKDLWESSIPFINFNIIGEILDEYKINGLEENAYKESLRWVSEVVENYFIPILWRKYVLRKYINEANLLKPIEKLKKALSQMLG